MKTPNYILLVAVSALFWCACSSDKDDTTGSGGIAAAGSGDQAGSVSPSAGSGGLGDSPGASDASGAAGTGGTNASPSGQCGNGIVDPGESCDPGVAVVTTCLSLGLGSGTVGCDANCHFDTSGCTGKTGRAGSGGNISSGGSGGAGAGVGGTTGTGGASGAGGTSGTGGDAGGGSGGTTGGTGGFIPPTEPNSIAYIGCSMAYNIGTGYKRVGGTIMWNSDNYQTSAMVVQNWTDSNSSSWRLFDQKMNSIGGKDTVKAIMVQICIFSFRATDQELLAMISSARQHVNPGTHIYIVGQPIYEPGHDCMLAGAGGAQWTDDQAKRLAADPSINENMSYLGTFLLDSTKGEVAPDTCHASSPAGEDALGRQAVDYFGG